MTFLSFGVWTSRGLETWKVFATIHTRTPPERSEKMEEKAWLRTEGAAGWMAKTLDVSSNNGTSIGVSISIGMGGYRLRAFV